MCRSDINSAFAVFDLATCHFGKEAVRKRQTGAAGVAMLSYVCGLCPVDMSALGPGHLQPTQDPALRLPV